LIAPTKLDSGVVSFNYKWNAPVVLDRMLDFSEL